MRVAAHHSHWHHGHPPAAPTAPIHHRAPSADTFTAAPRPRALQVPPVELERGDVGPQVLALQNTLVALGFMTRAQVATGPGVFGPRTEAAVARFQQAQGVQPVCGRYGPLTRGALQAVVQGKRPARSPVGAVDPSPAPPSSGAAAKVDAIVAGTPLAGKGAFMLQMAQKYRVPVELALAMFWHEAEFMTTGIAPLNNNPGNLRFVGQPGAVSGVSGFAQWPTVEGGIEAFFKLMNGLYRPFVDQKDWAGLVHLYAPSSDGNDEAAYVDSIETSMARYRKAIA
ncbi:MAG: peptidoglycan-binding protein [Myxococcaceae bacterium]|nr:peptidoglycan-binding protein [Myxococcaceae bacterium]